MSDERVTATHVWQFMGQRLTTDNNLRYAWLDEHGEECYFAKFRAYAIGRFYTVEVIDHEDGGRSVVGTPVYLDDEERTIDDTLVAQWTAMSHSATATKALRSRERNAAKHDAMRELLAPLREQYRKIIPRDQCDAFIASIIREVTR